MAVIVYRDKREPRIDPATIYPREVIAAVSGKIRWFREAGFPERALPLIDKFRKGLPLAPCEYYMGPTRTANPLLTTKQLNPPSLIAPTPAWSRYAGRVSDIDPEILRSSDREEIISMLIAQGTLDPDWEIHPPQDTVLPTQIALAPPFIEHSQPPEKDDDEPHLPVVPIDEFDEFEVSEIPIDEFDAVTDDDLTENDDLIENLSDESESEDI